AGLEHGHYRSGDLNGLLGLGVAAHAGGTLLDLEGSKAHQLHLVAVFQGGSDGVKRGGHNSLGLLLGNVGRSGDRIDEFSFVHGCYPPIQCVMRLLDDLFLTQAGAPAIKTDRGILHRSRGPAAPPHRTPAEACPRPLPPRGSGGQTCRRPGG
ncbi:Defence against restriction A C-terminal domain-containing protein, partial [Dysosmobacter welbionis]